MQPPVDQSRGGARDGGNSQLFKKALNTNLILDQSGGRRLEGAEQSALGGPGGCSLQLASPGGGRGGREGGKSQLLKRAFNTNLILGESGGAGEAAGAERGAAGGHPGAGGARGADAAGAGRAAPGELPRGARAAPRGGRRAEAPRGRGGGRDRPARAVALGERRGGGDGTGGSQATAPGIAGAGGGGCWGGVGGRGGGGGRGCERWGGLLRRRRGMTRPRPYY